MVCPQEGPLPNAHPTLELAQFQDQQELTGDRATFAPKSRSLEGRLAHGLISHDFVSGGSADPADWWQDEGAVEDFGAGFARAIPRPGRPTHCLEIGGDRPGPLDDSI